MEMNVAWMVGLAMTVYEYALQCRDAELERASRGCHWRTRHSHNESCWRDHVVGIPCTHQDSADWILMGFHETWHENEHDHHVAAFHFLQDKRQYTWGQPDPTEPPEDLITDIPF